MIKPKIIFMGTPDFASASLKALVEKGFDIVGVVTAPDRKAGRGQKIKYSSVKKYALEKKLNILQPTNLKDPYFIDKLKSLGAELQVVVAFRMLPEVVWQMPSLGTINLHASLLPKYRGAAPINWAIINGEKESGVTTFFIQKDIDTGNIIHQEKAIISNSDNAGTLHDKLMIIGAELICKTVDDITTGIAPNIEQKGSVSHAPKIFKQDCKVNWNQECKNIHNFIRGLSPYPTAFTNLSSDKSLKIYQTSIEIIEHQHSIGKIFSDKKSQMKIAVKDGFIHLEDIQISGKKRMRIDDFLRGFKMNENIHTT